MEQNSTPTKSPKNSARKKTKNRSKLVAVSNVETKPKRPIDFINGNSSLVKFFPTEVSDDDEHVLGQNTENINNDDDTNLTPRRRKGTEFKDAQTKQQSELSTLRHRDNGKENYKPNIDAGCQSVTMARPNLYADLDRVALENSNYSIPLETENIVRHRAIIPVQMEPDSSLLKENNKPKVKKRIRKKKKHIYDDSEDVTLLRKRFPLQPNLTNSEEQLELPLSVISEQLQSEISLPYFQKSELYRFGKKYETNLFQLIHQYLELDTFHRVGFVGQEKGSLAPLLEQHFCLIKPVMSIFPGKIDYKDVNDQKLLAFKIAHVGAEEYFSQISKDNSKERLVFDRIILHDSVHFFKDPPLTLRHIVSTLHEFGKILIIHRPGSLNTLPFFEEANIRICEEEIPYMKIITALQKIGCDVEWDLVHVPIEMPTTKWLAMLKAKFPPQMEIMSDFEIECGLRELSEGPLKYLQGTNMEAEDRLMFITASNPNFDCAFPSVQRVGGASQVPYSSQADAEYTLPLTEDLEMFLPKSTKAQYQMKGLF